MNPNDDKMRWKIYERRMTPLPVIAIEEEARRGTTILLVSKRSSIVNTIAQQRNKQAHHYFHGINDHQRKRGLLLLTFRSILIIRSSNRSILSHKPSSPRTHPSMSIVDCQ
jgi:hypothetical protein